MTQKPKLKIAFLYDDSLDGSEGVAQYVKTLGAWLSSRGHHVSYFVGQTKLKTWHGGKVYSLAKNQAVIFNGNRLSVPLRAKPKAITEALESEAPDIKKFQMPHSPLMSQRVINKAPKAAVVGTFHIFPANRLAKLGSRLLKLAYLGGLSAIAEVVSVSPAAQQFAADSFKIKSSVVPNMIDISSFRSGAVSTQRHEVVFLGRLVKRKGAQQLLQAFSLVNRQIPDSKLIIGGDGPEMPKLRSLAMQLGLSESIDFRGYIDEADKAKLLAQAEIACFPSLYGESFGIVLLEAMAAGSGIVLAGNNPGYVSVMSEVPEALFDPRDPEALAAKIIDFFEDETGSESVHQDQARLVKKFDVNRVGPQIEALYTRAIDKTSQARHN